MSRLLAILALVLATGAQAQGTDAIQTVLQEHRAAIERGSRSTIGPAIDAIADSGLPAAQEVLTRWENRELYQRLSDGFFFYGAEVDRDTLRIFDWDGTEIGVFPEDDFDYLRPNGGVRAMLGAALVRFQLMDPDPAIRAASLDAISRDAEASHLDALRGAIDPETDAGLRARKERLERLLTIRFDTDTEARIAAIEGFRGDLGVDVRAALNPLLATDLRAVEGPAPTDDPTTARVLDPGSAALSASEAYDVLVAQGAPPPLTPDVQRTALIDNAENGAVAGVQLASLGTEAARTAAYDLLAERGVVEHRASADEIAAALEAHSFYEVYTNPDIAVVLAAADALGAIERSVAFNQAADLSLDALSLAAIYFLAAIGLAVTFGVMGVINMAHGEFIMMGAYTGYVVQLFVPDYTLSILIALPAAFAVTFSAGVAMERLVIRYLYHRPLETLLATFGISIALQQLAKNIFGTQARPLTSPDWLAGSLVINDVVSISYIRIAIVVLALVFLALYLFIMRRTRLGLEVRAVTQNPRMAASMGINPDRINMLTFGLGSGIAGIAGVAIGLYAKVTSELGQDYIVQSFMTVVVGGVGNIWGTLLGATLIGFLQKGIEWMNPENTLAAQTYMILFIILFIQFRPKGIIALKGRAAEA